MPPQLQKVTSFSLEIEDWHSCHTSDDEAYEEALERNSVMSFYTARGAASSLASFGFASVGLGSPSRLADADQALEEMVPEPVSDPRPQHEPPELDEEEAPACKRTRSLSVEPSPSVRFIPIAPSCPCTAEGPFASYTTTPPIKAKPSSKSSSRRVTSVRANSPPLQYKASDCGDATMALRSEAPGVGAVRVCISVQQDSSSVKLHIMPAVFCFGNVPFPPTNTTDYAAMLLGPEGCLTAENSNFDYGEQHEPQLSHRDLEAPTAALPPGQRQPSPELEADCDVSLITHARGSPSCKGAGPQDSCLRNDPATPKDQNKVRRRAEGKERKSGGGFPGSFLIHRLFSGLRASRGGSIQQPLPSTSVHELGSELILASTAGAPAGLELAIAAAQSAPIVAGYVQASAPPSVPASAAASGGVADEAAVAAHRLSTDIFRNVLRASSGGAAEASMPKLSPRDTAFITAELQTPQRDQVPAAAASAAVDIATGVTTVSDSQVTTPTRNVARSGSNSHEQSPDDKQQPPGVAALALLVGLASDATTNGVSKPLVDAEADGQTQEAAEGCLAGAMQESLLVPVLSVDADCNGLPMPTLEQCDSPLTSKAASASTAECTMTTEAPVEPPLPAAPAASTTDPEAAATTCTATASPRTVSKKAYGTVARLVKKMAPNYRDSTVMSIMSVDSAHTSVGPPSVMASSVGFKMTDQRPSPGEVTADATSVPPVEVAAVDVQPSVAKAEVALEGAGLVGVADANCGKQDTSPCAAEPTVHGQACKSEGAPAATAETAGPQTPTMFVFGQEQVKAKSSASKPRSSASKSAVCDPATSTEAAGRKRKADDEILPNAKLPLVHGKGSEEAPLKHTNVEPLGPSASAGLSKEQDSLALGPMAGQQTVIPSMPSDTTADIQKPLAAAGAHTEVQEPLAATALLVEVQEPLAATALLVEVQEQLAEVASNTQELTAAAAGISEVQDVAKPLATYHEQPEAAGAIPQVAAPAPVNREVQERLIAAIASVDAQEPSVAASADAEVQELPKATATNSDVQGPPTAQEPQTASDAAAQEGAMAAAPVHGPAGVNEMQTVTPTNTAGVEGLQGAAVANHKVEEPASTADELAACKEAVPVPTVVQHVAKSEVLAATAPVREPKSSANALEPVPVSTSSSNVQKAPPADPRGFDKASGSGRARRPSGFGLFGCFRA